MSKGQNLSKEFVYANPPLREVIVELRWALTDLKVIEGAQIDPLFQSALPKFTVAMASIGFGVIESRVPDNAPLELFAYQPTRLFRQKPGAWPIYQIGPGIFVANAVPPYGGWSSFLPHVERGIAQAYSSYPEEFLRPQRITLRYLNAFRSSHGMHSPASFIRDALKLASPLPQQIVGSAEGGIDEILQSGSVRIPLSSPIDAVGRVIWGAGRFNNEETVNLELRVTVPTAERGTEYILGLLDGAHLSISKWFESLIPEDVRAHFGNKQEALSER